MIFTRKHFVFLITRFVRISFLFLILTLAFQLRKDPTQKTELKVYPYSDSQYFILGQKDVMADLIWLKILQNIDYCEGFRSKSVNENSKLQDILTTKLKPSRCDQGWVYQWLEFATQLAPRFQNLYSTGGTVLSVLVDDRDGAHRIFDKGLKLFPEDWVLNYRAGYHYLYEMQNPKRAADLLLMSYKNGGPDYLPALAAQLYTRIGQAEFAKVFLEQFLQENPDSENSDRIRQRLQEANQALQ